jgi:hypothetical protein
MRDIMVQLRTYPTAAKSTASFRFGAREKFEEILDYDDD